MIGEDKGEPGTILVPPLSTMPPSPVPRHRYAKGEPDFLQRWMNYSQFFVVGIIQSCPLVLLMRLPLYRLVVGIQVGAIQAVVILNQACGEEKIPVSATPAECSAGLRAQGSDRHCLRGQPEACLLTARAPPRARDLGQDKLTALLSSWGSSRGEPHWLAPCSAHAPSSQAPWPSGVPGLAAGVCMLGVLRGGGRGGRGTKTTYLVRALPADAREAFGLCQG